MISAFLSRESHSILSSHPAKLVLSRSTWRPVNGSGWSSTTGASTSRPPGTDHPARRLHELGCRRTEPTPITLGCGSFRDLPLRAAGSRKISGPGTLSTDNRAIKSRYAQGQKMHARRAGCCRSRAIALGVEGSIEPKEPSRNMKRR